MRTREDTTETGRLFLRRRVKQLPLERSVFELCARDLSLTPQTQTLVIARALPYTNNKGPVSVVKV